MLPLLDKAGLAEWLGEHTEVPLGPTHRSVADGRVEAGGAVVADADVEPREVAIRGRRRLDADDIEGHFPARADAMVRRRRGRGGDAGQADRHEGRHAEERPESVHAHRGHFLLVAARSSHGSTKPSAVSN